MKMYRYAPDGRLIETVDVPEILDVKVNALEYDKLAELEARVAKLEGKTTAELLADSVKPVTGVDVINQANMRA